MTKSRLKKSIAIATTAALIVLGVLFIISALNLFLIGGNRPYSRERVTNYLIPLIPSAVITVLLIIFGFVFAFLSKEKDCEVSHRSVTERLSDYSKRFIDSELPKEEKDIILSERAKRKRINLIFISSSILVFLIALVYVIFFASFSVEELSHDVLLAFAVALPLFIISVGIHIPRLYLLDESSSLEYDTLRACVKKGVKPSAPVSPKEYKHEKRVELIAKGTVLLAATAFVVIGIINGGMEDVLGKAVKICTECIGLG